jgi:adenine-specific DNA methylase
MKIYRFTCKLCGKVIENDNFELARKNIRHHLISHEELKPMADALIKTYATLEIQEVEEVVIA